MDGDRLSELTISGWILRFVIFQLKLNICVVVEKHEESLGTIHRNIGGGGGEEKKKTFIKKY